MNPNQLRPCAGKPPCLECCLLLIGLLGGLSSGSLLHEVETGVCHMELFFFLEFLPAFLMKSDSCSFPQPLLVVTFVCACS